MRKWLNKINTVLTRAWFVAVMLLAIIAVGNCTFNLLSPTHAKEKCKVWDIQPPVLCEQNKGERYYISGHEMFQRCENRTGVLWVWDGMKPRFKADAWIPVSSYNVEHAQIYEDCFVYMKNSACNKFSKTITEIVDCQERNRNE